MADATTKRKEWIDIARGYGIIFVIFAHIVKGAIAKWLFTFHLPLFFVLSGYLFNGNENFPDFLKKKIKGLVLPYFALGIPTVIFQAIHENINCFELFVDFCIQKRLWTFWFLALLFFLNILYYFLNRIIPKIYIKLAVSFVLSALGLIYYKLGGSALPWNIDTCLMTVPFFALGDYYRQNEEKIDGFVNGKLLPVFIICFIINVVSGYYSFIITGKQIDMFANDYGVPILFFTSAIAGIICIIIISKKYNNPFISYFGKNSLVYYAWHQQIATPIVEDIYKAVGIVLPVNCTVLEHYAYYTSIFILVMVICFLFDFVVKKIESLIKYKFTR